MSSPPPQEASLARVEATALRMLTAREHGCAELAAKLRQHHYDSELIAVVIKRLRRQNYLNDVRFAEALLLSRARKGYAPRFAEKVLHDKGVAVAAIDKALAHADLPSETSLIHHLCDKRGYPSLNASLTRRERRKEFARIYRFLQRRGFSQASILEALDARRAQVNDSVSS